ncbi:MAG TPA: CehA/McbA family metallohydrolase [Candidatus Baltobacteraceae bacterium]|nr:CehA/McbA family metallohydrolase [Candidatus Baltobacteraceae bacterium]
MRTRRFTIAAVLTALGLHPLVGMSAVPSSEDLTRHFAGASHAPLLVMVLDADTGEPVPCCIYLKDAAGNPVQPQMWPFWHDHFVCPGVAKLDLPFGAYSYEIDRGPEYLLTTGRFTVSGNGALGVTCQLHRLADLTSEGWWSGELHIHRSIADIKLLMQASDLHVAPVITWWNAQNMWTEQPPPSNPLIRFDRDRFCQLMAGEYERHGGAVLFFNLERPLDMIRATREFPSSMQFITEARRHPGAWIDIEKPFWWDVPVWLASGMVDSIGIAHNQMQRNGGVPTEAWGRSRDMQRFPGPQGDGFWTQTIYYHVLNCGLRLPPSAGSASGVLPNPVGYDRMYVHLDGEPSYQRWWAGLKAGQVFVSNGPLLRCRANGELPGHVFKTTAGRSLTLKLDVALDSRDPISALEIIQNGRVIRTVSYAEWKQIGSLGSVTFEESGWFLVRAMANVPNTFRFASTGPFYVEIGPISRRISEASAQFFLDWVRERMRQIRLDDPREQAEVLKYHQQAEQFWQEMVARANAP